MMVMPDFAEPTEVERRRGEWSSGVSRSPALWSSKLGTGDLLVGILLRNIYNLPLLLGLPSILIFTCRQVSRDIQ